MQWKNFLFEQNCELNFQFEKTFLKYSIQRIRELNIIFHQPELDDSNANPKGKKSEIHIFII